MSFLFNRGPRKGESPLAYELRKTTTAKALYTMSKHTVAFPATGLVIDVPVRAVRMKEGRLDWGALYTWLDDKLVDDEGAIIPRDYGVPGIEGDIRLTLSLLEQLEGELALAHMNRVIIYQGGLAVLAIHINPESAPESSLTERQDSGKDEAGEATPLPAIGAFTFYTPPRPGSGRSVSVDMRRLRFNLAEARARDDDIWGLNAACAVCAAGVAFIVWNEWRK